MHCNSGTSSTSAARAAYCVDIFDTFFRVCFFRSFFRWKLSLTLRDHAVSAPAVASAAFAAASAVFASAAAVGAASASAAGAAAAVWLGYLVLSLVFLFPVPSLSAPRHDEGLGESPRARGAGGRLAHALLFFRVAKAYGGCSRLIIDQ